MTDFKTLLDRFEDAAQEAARCEVHNFWRAMSAAQSDMENTRQDLMEEIETLQLSVAELEAAARWIPVGERLPDKETEDRGEEYLVVTEIPPFGGGDLIHNVMAADWRNGKWITGSYMNWCDWTDRVTHWRPLPAPPEEKESEEK